MESTIIQMQRKIEQHPEGTLFFPEDFAELGSYDNVRKSLERLSRTHKLTRIAQGIYTRPKNNPYIGAILPSAEEIAEAIARRDHARTVPTGSAALHALGLSTQVPMNLVLLTDGAARDVKIGKRTIKFKKTTPRNLAAKGQISRLVIQALKAIGQEGLQPADEQKILSVLRKESHDALLHDIKLAPVWIQEIMKKAL